MAGVAKACGGDHTTDLSRLLRIPGTMNRKDERNGRVPVPTALVECEPTRRYALATFEPFDNAEASYTLRLDTDTDLATLAERCAALAESLPARAAPIEVLDGTPAVASSTG